MDLLLKNLCWHDGIEKVSGDVRITKSVIAEIGNNLGAKKGELVGSFEDHFLYPGLINAHDHLEMNLYPKLGTPPYNNYVDWAKDIYKPAQSPLREIEKLNIEDRLLWGGLKNLVAGVTTVIHHNPWHRSLGKKEFPVKVLKIAWAHSLAFEKKIQKKNPGQHNTPFVIHAAEGIDQLAFSEIATLDNLGLLTKNTVLIHAVALKDQDIETISTRRSSVVWCPASNVFMFDQTAPIQKLKGRIRVALGSDSTLTGSPTLLHEIQFANKRNCAAKEIYEMVTRIPAQIFNLPDPKIAPAQPGNLFIAPIKNEDYFENLMDIQPADISLVLINGTPRLKNAETDDQWMFLKNTVKIQGTLKCCDIDVSSLKKGIGKKISASILETNPLWKLIEV